MLKYTENTYNSEGEGMLRRKLLYLFLTVPLYAWLISMTKIELMALFLGYVFIFQQIAFKNSLF